MFVNNINVPTINYIYGIGGRDTTVNDIKSVYTDLQDIATEQKKLENGCKVKVENPYRYLGLRRKL